jgi:hypothetical protein
MQRNSYFNKALVELLKHIKPGAPSIKHINILVQLYDRLANHELVTTIDPKVTAYLAANPIDFWNHSLCHMAEYLEPNSNFKSSEPVLDQWQRDMLRAIKERKNIFLNLPTSAGKTSVHRASWTNARMPGSLCRLHHSPISSQGFCWQP